MSLLWLGDTKIVIFFVSQGLNGSLFLFDFILLLYLYASNVKTAVRRVCGALCIFMLILPRRNTLGRIIALYDYKLIT